MTSKDTNIVVYQASDGSIELRWDSNHETIWASQAQMAEIFGVDIRTINEHINNIFNSKELEKDPTIRKFQIVQQEGNRKVKRDILHYNLDMIISIWYRINSVTATKFRQWATKTLKQHITQWYTINKNRIQQNYDLFLHAVEEVKALSHQNKIWSDDVLELITFFWQTWFSLDAYDRWELSLDRPTQKKVTLQAKKLYTEIQQFKTELMKKWEATELFAYEKQPWSLEWIIGNVLQTAFGKDVYPSIESKAVHLLYFIIKNHPFNDGNKRTGAFAFVRFLQMVWYNFRSKITPETLTSITLLIATSDPQDKQRVVDLVMLLLWWDDKK